MEPIVVELIDSMPDPKKLKLLADWLDLQQRKGVLTGGSGAGVQEEIREWATIIERFNTTGHNNYNQKVVLDEDIKTSEGSSLSP